MVSPASGLTANLTGDPATSDTAPAWSPGRHQDRLHPRGGRRHDQHHDHGQRRGR
jgi:hypothetical protein